MSNSFTIIGTPTSSTGSLVGTPLTYLFTSKPEMERVFSEEGIDYRNDDYLNDANNQVVIQEIMEEATYIAKSILNAVYEDVDLYRHTWVRRKTTYIACYLISIRRGNPSQYLDMYGDSIDQFKALIEGSLTMQDLPRARFASIVMQNVHVDNRFPFAPLRVDVLNSVGSTGREFIMTYIPFVWL